MGLLDNAVKRARTVFLPQFNTPPAVSIYEDDPDGPRKERAMPSRSQTEWFQGQIRDAIQLADSGDISQAARLARAMRRDGTLGGILSTRTGGLMRLPKIFRGTYNDRFNIADDLVSGEETGLFDRVFPSRELALLAADGILLGVGVGELIYVEWRVEPIFVRLSPEFLRYVWAEDRWYYNSIAGRVAITPGDGRWILHTPGGYQEPWNNALWSSLGRAYIAKEHAISYRENYSGKLANPARAAINPAGSSDPQKVGFLQRVIDWGVNTVFDLPPGWDVKLIESNGVGYQVFADTIKTSDLEFMVSLAGQIVTITGGAGFANANIHETIRSDLIQSDGDELAATLNDQGLRPVIDFMYGGGYVGTVAWDTRPPGDLQAEATALSAASSAITDGNVALKPYGLEIDADEMVARHRIPAKRIAEPNPAVAQLPAPEPAAPDPTPAPTPTSDADASNVIPITRAHPQ